MGGASPGPQECSRTTDLLLLVALLATVISDEVQAFGTAPVQDAHLWSRQGEAEGIQNCALPEGNFDAVKLKKRFMQKWEAASDE